MQVPARLGKPGQVAPEWRVARDRGAFVDDDAMLTKREAAKLLGVSTSTLDRMRRAGTAPPSTRLPSGHLRFRKGDLRAWLTEHRERPGGPEPGPAG